MRFRVFDKEKKEFVDETNYVLNHRGEILPVSTYMQPIAYATRYCIPVFSTELTDKNGKEYEAGSLFFMNNILHEIYWCKETAAFCVRDIKNEILNSFLLCFKQKEFEIIGSKYTNPELLEQ